MWGGQQGEPLKGSEAPVGSRAEPMVWGPGSQAPLKLKAFWCLYVYRTGHIIPLFGIWREKFTFHIQLKVNYSCEHLVCSLPYKKVKPPEASMAPLGEATGVIWTSPIIFRLCPLWPLIQFPSVVRFGGVMAKCHFRSEPINGDQRGRPHSCSCHRDGQVAFTIYRPGVLTLLQQDSTEKWLFKSLKYTGTS